MKNRYSLAAKLLVMFMLAASATACSSGGNELEEGKVNVVTTFYPLYDFAKKIGGEQAHVINLVPAGVEVHEWSPKPQDMVHMTKADLLIYNGLGLEGWLDDFLETLGKDAQVHPVQATAQLEPIRLDEEEGGVEEDHEHELGHEHGEYDPHAWLSPVSAKQMAAAIRDAYILTDAVHAPEYEANYEQLAAKLDQLDEHLRAAMEAGSRRDIVVSHDAYGYLERDYGLKQVPVMGLSPESEPAPQDMKQIVEYVSEHGVKYILFEELASPRLASTLAEEAGVETLVFNPAEGLTAQQEQAGDDYFSIMERNLTSLEKALQ